MCTPYNTESQKIIAMAPFVRTLTNGAFIYVIYRGEAILCLHRIASPRKLTPRIKQCDASYYTSEATDHWKPKNGCHGNVSALVAGYWQYLHFVGRPLTTTCITNSIVAIVHTKPIIAILVPKLVAMATSLRCKVSAISAFCWLATQGGDIYGITHYVSQIPCVGMVMLNDAGEVGEAGDGCWLSLAASPNHQQRQSGGAWETLIT